VTSWVILGFFSEEVCFYFEICTIDNLIHHKLSMIKYELPSKRVCLFAQPVACTINVYDHRFYDRKLHSSLERKL
jgi:hypothetical protein